MNLGRLLLMLVVLAVFLSVISASASILEVDGSVIQVWDERVVIDIPEPTDDTDTTLERPGDEDHENREQSRPNENPGD